MLTNVERTVDEICEWVRDFFDKNGKGCSAVLGISGGKDSCITAALLARALGKERVVGVMMPDGIQPDISDSQAVVDFLGIRNYTVNIGEATKALKKSLEEAGSTITKDVGINIPPRIRMTTLYAVAQGLEEGGRVINTCNKSEDYIGYSTKYGDAAGDMSILAGFTVEEVLQIGDFLGLPSNLVHKTPSDGLSGMSDEDKVGFTYAVLDKYIATGECEDETIKAKIDRMHVLNLHKLNVMPHFEPSER
ncbi:MAG: NAD(+) synthase [Lachnospiraceae bacterium]|nr:NAD(+) synthase [Lachnospiraceae bacterium]MBO4882513.1 NAD(+) synthase [Lachnospiraceae bacterium]